jgi:hypothetical protein
MRSPVRWSRLAQNIDTIPHSTGSTVPTPMLPEGTTKFSCRRFGRRNDDEAEPCSAGWRQRHVVESVWPHASRFNHSRHSQLHATIRSAPKGLTSTQPSPRDPRSRSTRKNALHRAIVVARTGRQSRATINLARLYRDQAGAVRPKIFWSTERPDCADVKEAEALLHELAWIPLSCHTSALEMASSRHKRSLGGKRME